MSDRRILAHMAEAGAARLIYRAGFTVAAVLALLGMTGKAGAVAIVAGLFWLGRPAPCPDLDKHTGRDN